MMVVTRRQTRPESPRRVRRKLLGAAAEAEIGSRVFPLPAPAPPPPPMPSVGARRSTRVFLPKASSTAAPANSCGNGDSRTLRSGKRLALSKSADEWLEDLGSGGTLELKWWNVKEKERPDVGESAVLNEPAAAEHGGGDVRESPKFDCPRDSLDPLQEKKFAIVYERKRHRQLSDGAASSSSSAGDGIADSGRRFGLVFVRKGRRKRFKVAPLPHGIKELPIVDEDGAESSQKQLVFNGGLGFATSAAMLVKKIRAREDILCTSFSSGMVLLLLVEPSCSSSSLFFARFLVSVFRWIRRTRAMLGEFAAFLLSGPLASVFSQQGVHIVPLSWRRDNDALKNVLPYCGQCKIYGSTQSAALIWINFLALPSYFSSLYIKMLHGSLYLPHSLRRYLMCLCSSTGSSDSVDSGGNYSPPVDSVYLPIEHSGLAATEGYAQNANANAHRSDGHNVIILHGSRLSKHRRKRSFLKHLRTRNLPSIGPRIDTCSNQSSRTRTTSAEAKASIFPEVIVKPIYIEVPDPCVEDSLSCKDESDVSTPLHGRQRKSAKKSPVEQNKEIRSALADVRQNIETAQCKANLLVTIGDRCWREEGFQVMMCMLAPQEWYIVVKFKGEVKFLHKPLEMRPCVVNRFTHAYMWAGEDRWKLEFLDRWDWLVFKELHMECRERNLQEASLRTIPVPVYKEVPAYEEDAGATFVLPDEYIRINDDEVRRALLSKVDKYDMDSGDEQWLFKHNTVNSHKETSQVISLSGNDFEKIIYAMEKFAYSNVDDVHDKEKVLDVLQHFGDWEMLSLIYEYWMKKRTKRHAPLIREFQGPPLRKAQLVHKPFLRKKRSLKRQRSQTARIKPEVISPVGIDNGALQRVEEAQNATKRAMEYAIRLRKRAQMLMTNAELAVYKSVMALRIADSVEASDASEHASLIID